MYPELHQIRRFLVDVAGLRCPCLSLAPAPLGRASAVEAVPLGAALQSTRGGGGRGRRYAGRRDKKTGVPVYCECGATTDLTATTAAFVPAIDVLAELDDYLGRKPGLDFVTFAGSGEPTLHAELGRHGRRKSVVGAAEPLAGGPFVGKGLAGLLHDGRLNSLQLPKLKALAQIDLPDLSGEDADRE
jgi:hypothetical protein